jgi:glycosyltransferase involved in cell wall biosynthesis
MADLCLITTCKGRLLHLQQTLGPATRQPRCSCVVVDYACPDGSGDWVEQHYPTAKVVRVSDQGFLNLSRARNAGAAAAEADWLCFFDADVILSPHFAERLLPGLQAGHYYVAEPWTRHLTGTFICSRSDFQRVGGYDEVFQGWGEEDVDLYSRLGLHGVRQNGFDRELISPIQHDDALRVQHRSDKVIEETHSINLLYRLAKLDLMRLLSKDLSLQERQNLYREAQESVLLLLQNGQQSQWRIAFHQTRSLLGQEITSTLVYSVRPGTGQ